ncbi:MAG: ImmA/IrrE family metallo-endopeptidase [Coriobacteriia bacterium]|nr:ImmA/IrrE family metallo-endopeptidase [Coriobacteriia bacterium]
MPIHTEAHYRQVAADALRQASLNEPPIPLEQLAAQIGIPVRVVQLPTFFSGALIAEDGMPVAVVNSAQRIESGRRTLAHLLAHVLIVLSDSGERYPRDLVRDHREADVAADELLLPERVVRNEARMWFNDYRYLARAFGVTEVEMVRRMRELGIIKARGMHPGA